MLGHRATRVVAAAKLHRAAARARSGRFLAEGPNLIEAAGRRGLIRELYATAAAAERHADLLTDQRVAVQPVTDRAAASLSDTVTPAGLVAVCAMPQPALPPAPALAVVAVGVAEPGNAGTLIRLADAMGADAVILAGHAVDPYNGKCLRASAGSIFAVPVISEPDTAAALSALRARGMRLLATTLDGETSLDDAGALLDGPTGWLFGPEAHGLPPEVAAAADHRVRIPMAGDAESLNVAAAAAICLYASARAARVRPPRAGQAP
ncbi:TrmH family RNA methyltransferase [Mycolicibacillus trivialis]|uniref:RNA methyltransferase n=1 Tax=Mycolicibacillus trivialis TaxID=1798 RepID=A0A1X2EQ32_9MYCO|nr:RNA methyltransferase [Mycolicibacillus trivialis]ORX08179.1 RNA methyltransferase [Mycolicibacillus trivialis]